MKTSSYSILAFTAISIRKMAAVFLLLGCWSCHKPDKQPDEPASGEIICEPCKDAACIPNPECELIRAALDEYAHARENADIDRIDRILTSDYEKDYFDGNQLKKMNKNETLNDLSYAFGMINTMKYQFVRSDIIISAEGNVATATTEQLSSWLETNGLLTKTYPDPAVTQRSVKSMRIISLRKESNQWLIAKSTLPIKPYALYAQYLEAANEDDPIEVSFSMFRADDPQSQYTELLTGGQLTLPDGGKTEIVQNPDSTDSTNLAFVATVTMPKGLGLHKYELTTNDPEGNQWILPFQLRTRQSPDRWYNYTPLSGLPTTKQEMVEGSGSIEADPNGRIWVGTEKGLMRYENGKWDLIAPKGILDKPVQALHVDKSGMLWASVWDSSIESGWLVRFNGDIFEKIELPILEGIPDALATDLDGSLLVSYSTKSKYFQLARWHDGVWEFIEVPEQYTISTVLSIAVGTDDALWFGTYANGVLRKKGNDWSAFRSGSALSPDQAKTLEEHFQYIAAQIADNTPLSSIYLPGTRIPLGKVIDSKEDFVVRVHALPDGRILIGTAGAGIRILKPDGSIERHLWRNDEIPSGYMPNWFGGGFQSDNHGGAWIATNKGAAHLFADGHVERYANSDGLFGIYICGIAVDSEGNTWFSHNKGISVRRADDEPEFVYSDLDRAQSTLRNALDFVNLWQNSSVAPLWFTEQVASDISNSYLNISENWIVSVSDFSAVEWTKLQPNMVRATGKYQQVFLKWAEKLEPNELRSVVVFDYPKATVELGNVNGRWKLVDDFQSKSPYCYIKLSTRERSGGSGRKIIIAGKSTDSYLESVALNAFGQIFSAAKNDKGSFGLVINIDGPPDEDVNVSTYDEIFTFHFKMKNGSEQVVKYKWSYPLLHSKPNW